MFSTLTEVVQPVSHPRAAAHMVPAGCLHQGSMELFCTGEKMAINHLALMDKAAQLQCDTKPNPVPGGDTKTRSQWPVSSSAPAQQHGTGKDGTSLPWQFLVERAGHRPQIWAGSEHGTGRG